MKYKIDVYIVDDHTMLNEGLTDAINRYDTVHVSRCFTTLADCRTTLAERSPDVILLDITMPDGDGVDFCQWVISEYPKVKVVAVTIHDEYCVIKRMLSAGAHGYVLKNAPVGELIKAIEQVWKGQRYICPEIEEVISQAGSMLPVITKQEQSILRYVCDGLTNVEIGERMSLSAETIKWYRKRLLSKFGMKNTLQLVKLVMKEHLLP